MIGYQGVIEEAVALGLLLREASRHTERISCMRSAADHAWLCLLIQTAPRRISAFEAPTIALALEGALRRWIEPNDNIEADDAEDATWDTLAGTDWAKLP